MSRRRDPRAERAACTVMVGSRPRLLREAPPAGADGKRRDPRALRTAALVQSHPRPRYDWTREAGAAAGATIPVPESVPAIPPTIITDPTFLVLAVLDRPGGAVSDHDRQVVAACRTLADAAGGAVVTVATGTGEALAAAGSDRHIALPHTWAGGWWPEARAHAVVALLRGLNPRHALFPDTADGADLARRVAAACGERLFTGVQNLTPDRAARQAVGGSREMAHAPLRLMTLAADAVLPLEGVRHEAVALDVPALSDLPAPRLTDVRRLAVDPDGLALAEADFLLSAGNGVTDWEVFTELARLLGATRAGSRVVCDAGHLPRSRQVGASGTVVTARTYLAFGIAGAPQHLQGIPAVKQVIAINTDLHAEMIKRADLAVVADAQAIMPALIRHIRERRHG